MRARKLFAGRRIREMRQQHELTQAAFAKRLGISTSYLNQLENNQRHVSASVLLALASAFSLDIATLSGDDDDRLLADMAEALADPVFGDAQPVAQDIRLVVQNAPSVARAFLALHQAMRRSGEQLAELDETIARSGALAEPAPYDEVRDFFHYIGNYIHELDLAAERFRESLGVGRDLTAALAAHVERAHGIRVALAGDGARPGTLRRYDPQARILTLNARAGAPTNAFQIAHQIALIEQREAIEAIIARAQLRATDAAAILRIGLANYFAGATVMPYGAFAAAARELRHDLELLAARFGASLEQAAHRLSTLQRPGAPGVPFFFARVDQAGNITKRHSAARLQFARFGSACPLWNVHRAFETPGRILRQLAETPDGARYLCLAVAVVKRSGGFRDPERRYALALGTEIVHAPDLVYADDLDLERDQAFEPIGVSCRICERRDCQQRALPPLKRRLSVDHDIRDVVPYRFD